MGVAEGLRLTKLLSALKHTLFCFGFALFFSSCGHTEKAYVDRTKYLLLEDSKGSLTATEAWQKFKNGEFVRQEQNSFNPGFTKSIFWLVARPTGDEQLQLIIGTPQINRLEFYTIKNDAPSQRILTGDYEPFSHRPQPTLDFTFPVYNGETYLIGIDKRNEALQLTFNTLPSQRLWHEFSESSIIIGVFTGTIAIMLLFGIYLSIITRKRVYLFYVLYVAGGWLYVLANLGYGYKYLWPMSPWFASRARPVFTLVTIGLSVQFIEHYTGKALHKWQNVTFKSLSYLSYSLCVVFLLPFIEVSGNKTAYVLQGIIPILVAIYIIAALSDLIEKSLRRNSMAIFYLSAIAILFLLTTLQLLHYSGGLDLSGTFLETYGQALGYVSESVILTLGLAYQFSSYQKEREVLLINLNQQQVKYTKAIITTQEMERRQLADQLHDVAGSLLSAAKLNLSSIREKTLISSREAQTKLATAEDAVTSISEILRNMSHAISPVMLDKVGFRQSVEKIATIFNSSEKIKVEMEIIGFEDDQPAMHEKYSVLYGILYELINNIAKHAEATHALVQLIEHDDTVALIVEDNGKGLNISETEKSQTHGLAAIKSKIHYLDGQITFDEAVPRGLIVTIEIPKE